MFEALSPLPKDEMLNLAEQLHMEIARGLTPVWPTTRAYAHRLVLGLRTMRMTRPDQVVRVMNAAPVDTTLDWPELLSTV